MSSEGPTREGPESMLSFEPTRARRFAKCCTSRRATGDGAAIGVGNAPRALISSLLISKDEATMRSHAIQTRVLAEWRNYYELLLPSFECRAQTSCSFDAGGRWSFLPGRFWSAYHHDNITPPTPSSFSNLSTRRVVSIRLAQSLSSLPSLP